MSMRAAGAIYSAFQLAAAGALIGWCVMSVYQDRQLDQCTRNLNRQIQDTQARIKTIRVRQESLEARAAEATKTLAQKKRG
jgi:hypothetical protein